MLWMKRFDVHVPVFESFGSVVDRADQGIWVLHRRCCRHRGRKRRCGRREQPYPLGGLFTGIGHTRTRVASVVFAELTPLATSSPLLGKAIPPLNGCISLTDCLRQEGKRKSHRPDAPWLEAGTVHLPTVYVRRIQGEESHLAGHRSGRFDLWQELRSLWERLPVEGPELLRFILIRTGELVSCLATTGHSPDRDGCEPHSTCWSRKAMSVYVLTPALITSGLPIVLITYKKGDKRPQLRETPITPYGDGLNVHDCLYINGRGDVHLLAATLSRIRQNYSIGRSWELHKKTGLDNLCILRDPLRPGDAPIARPGRAADDRANHDRSHGTEPSRICEYLCGRLRHNGAMCHAATVR